MESTKDINYKCYIMETKFSAGIFLSIEIAKRKKYFEHLKIKEFKNYDSAENEFFKLYGESVKKEEFKVNNLYQVRSKNVYSAFYSEDFVGITYTNNFWSNVVAIVGNYKKRIFALHALEYDNAVQIVRKKFVEQYRKSEFYISGGIPINAVITFEDMLKRNHLINR